MKPYLIVAADFVKTGGMDRANYALARYLADNGFETHLVTYRAAGSLSNHSNITIHTVPKFLNSYTLADPYLAFVGRKWAERIASRGGRVVVNGGNCYWNDVNWVHYVHAEYAPKIENGKTGKVWRLLRRRFALSTERRSLKIAGLTIANSNRTKLGLMRLLGVPDSRVCTIYYGTDRDRFRPASPADRRRLRKSLGWRDEEKIAIFIGGLGDRRKGFDTVYSAWRELCRQKWWNANLMVVGSGADLPDWKRRALRDGVAPRIHFLGFRDDVPNLLRAADVMVAPTRYEAYGLGVHEALSCGLAAFVSKSAGVSERYPIQLRDFLLDDPDDVDMLVIRLRDWYIDGSGGHKAAIAQLSDELRSYSWDDMASQMVSTFESAGSEGNSDRMYQN